MPPLTSRAALAPSAPEASADLLADLGERPPAQVASAPLRTGAEAAQTLPAALVYAARHCDARILHLDAAGNELVQSFPALLDEAQQIMTGLRVRGLAPGAFVILQLAGSRELLSTFWGCLLGGFVPVVAPVPPTYALATHERDKLCQVWRLLGEPMIVSERERLPSLLGLSGLIPLNELRVVAWEQLAAHAYDERPLHPSQPDDLAFLSLSSGSTGVPKCIELTHRAILARARGASLACAQEPSDVVFNWLPFDHIGSISDWHLRCVDLGCNMVYAPKERVLAEPLEWLRVIERYRVTHSWAPNFAFARINAALAAAGSERWDLACLKGLLTAGEAVSSETLGELLQRLSAHGLARTAVRSAFGMAELGSGITYSVPTEAEPFKSLHVDRASLRGVLRELAAGDPRGISFTCLGPPIAGTSMRIVDDQDCLLHERQIGRLQVRGSALARGYHANAEANRVFRNDGWFETGDQGFVAGGELYLTGRSKDCLIVRGANYFPIEIEKAVEELPGVEVSFTAAYSVRPPQATSEQVAIFFSPKSGREQDLAELLRAIQQRVAHKLGLRPDYLIPLAKDAIPKTAIGKIQRKQLAAAFEAGAFDEIVQQTDLLLENERTLPNWFAAPTWQRRPLGAATVEPAPTTTLCVCDAAGLADALASQLTDSVQVEAGDAFAQLDARRYRMDLARAEHWTELLHALGRPRAIELVDLRGFGATLSAWESSTIAPALQSATQQVLGPLRALSTARPHDLRVCWSVASCASQRVHPGDTICPARALVPVLLASAARGADWLTTRHVDFSPECDEAALAQHAHQLACELRANTPSGQVAYRGDVRLVHGLSEHMFTPPAAATLLQPGGFYLITGGLGGIGVELARSLMTRLGARVLLVGRSAVNPGVQGADVAGPEAALAQLRSLGSVAYAELDVAQAEALERVVRATELCWGEPLRAVFHLAGTSHEAPLRDETWESVWRVLAPKVLGGLAIEALVRTRPEASVVHFSSVLGTLPSATTGAYAAANRFLDVLSERQRCELGRASYSLGFSAWNGLGMSAGGSSERVLRARGLVALDAARALDSLWVALGQPAANLLIGVDPEASLEPSFHGADPRRERQPTSVALTSGAAPETATEALLVPLWQAVLGVANVSVTDDFFALGGQSLAAVELTRRINQVCRTNFPLSAVFESPTIREQARLLDQGRHAVSASVIPLAAEGDAPPLFCLCGINLYQALARHLAPKRPVFGVLLPVEQAVAEGADVKLDVPSMAREYVEAIRDKQPRGPYRLLGLSFGAVLAYEVAQQLRAAGDEVVFLGLLDFVLRDGRADSIAQRALKRVAGWKQALWPEPRERPPEDPTMRAYARAWTQYEPTLAPYAGSAVIFRAQEATRWQGNVRPDCGWSAYVEQLEHHEVPGDHLGMIREPHVARLAELVSACLARSDGAAQRKRGAVEHVGSRVHRITRPSQPALSPP